MKLIQTAAALHNLREQPLWQLLAADKAPVTVALLQHLLLDGDKSLVGSVLHERLARAMESLRATGEDLPQTAQQYASDWLSKGWLTRRFPAGSSEEEYELSAEAVTAIRFITGVLTPRTTATESRLSLVIQQLGQLAEQTDPNAASRLQSLRAERERIDRAIAETEQGGVKVLPNERALERLHEIVALAEELTHDFRSVRDQFDRLNRSLRQSLMEHEGSRAEVLEQLFAGVDLIGESEAGKTFDAFWRLLTDSEQAATLVGSLDEIASRPFARQLETRERKFLLSLTSVLLAEGGGVHDVFQNLARSLKSFVQSREYQEQRRLHSLLKTANQAALAAKDAVRANQPAGYSLMLTSGAIRSAAQWVLYDPSQRVVDAAMAEAAPAEIDLATVSDLVRQSEIDLRTLCEHVISVLERQSQASIGQLLAVFPAEQGLGSVVGYAHLGVKHGEVTNEPEIVSWEGGDGTPRRARLPTIFFTRERLRELQGRADGE